MAGGIAEVLVEKVGPGLLLETLHALTDRKVDSSKHFSRILKRRKTPQVFNSQQVRTHKYSII